MKQTDERLRLAYSDALRNRARSARASCPAPEALLAVAERTGSEAVRLETLDHIMACDRCRHELDLVRASVVAAGAPRQRPWFLAPSLGLMALAAALVVAAGVRLYVASGDLESGPRLRGAGGVATHQVQWLPGVGARLAWAPASGAVSYRIEVIDDSGRAVVDTTIRDTSFVVADFLARRNAGAAWTVSATLNDGTSVNSMPTRLDPPPK